MCKVCLFAIFLRAMIYVRIGQVSATQGQLKQASAAGASNPRPRSPPAGQNRPAVNRPELFNFSTFQLFSDFPRSDSFPRGNVASGHAGVRRIDLNEED